MCENHYAYENSLVLFYFLSMIQKGINRAGFSAVLFFCLIPNGKRQFFLLLCDEIAQVNLFFAFLKASKHQMLLPIFGTSHRLQQKLSYEKKSFIAQRTFKPLVYVTFSNLFRSDS